MVTEIANQGWQLRRAKRGRKHTELKNVARMAPCKPFLSESCFWGRHLRGILGISQGVKKRNGIGGGGQTVPRWGASETVFRGGLLVRFCKPPLFFLPPPPPPFGVLWDRPEIITFFEGMHRFVVLRRPRDPCGSSPPAQLRGGGFLRPAQPAGRVFLHHPSTVTLTSWYKWAVYLDTRGRCTYYLCKSIRMAFRRLYFPAFLAVDRTNKKFTLRRI